MASNICDKCDRCSENLLNEKEYNVEDYEAVFLCTNFAICPACFDDVILQVAEGIKKGRA